MSGKKNFIIPQETLDAQKKAANPGDSVWVSANAGSGKTHVLTERVIRLLLNGTEPSKILCLTYTKAAAAVMQNRVFARLSEWATLSDEKLAETLEKLERVRPDARRLAQARRLFARALETPGGLKIQTIHAFCEAILHQFPLEANIAGHFELMDDLMQGALVGEARRQVLETALIGSDPAIKTAFDRVLSVAGESGLQALFDEAINKRQELLAFLHEAGTGEQRGAALYRAFGFIGDETEDELLSDVWPLPEFPDAVLNRLLAISKGAARAQDFALQLRVMKTAPIGQREDILRAAFLKATGEPKSGSYISSKAVADLLPDFADTFDRVALRVFETLDRLKQYRLIGLNLSAFVLLDDLLSRYQKMKRARGLLDFDDLIARTATLLARQDVGPWVQYKLDKGIDHILVDEAQDTSPGQWNVIRALSEEFFSGTGARNVRRTLFAVGDEKQSIYSFQGALPEEFAGVGRATRSKAEDAELTFENVKLNFSFRSTGDVLSAVDKVFSQPAAYRGMGGETVHDAIRSADPGEVEIWDVLASETVEEEEDWRKPVDQLQAPAVRLADHISRTIQHWLRSGEIIHGQRRRIEAKDVMVLVRKRDKFMPALSRALKNLNIPVAGADRLRLTGHIAIKDLMSIGRFVLQPADDLSLAALLKSPLFSWSDDRLFNAVWPRRKGETLYARLRKLAETDEKTAQVVATLQHWRSRADQVPVFEFYADILGRGGARRRLLARLGHEAGDVIDEFQNYALAIARTGLPGLQAFLETLDATAPEIKREMDQNRDEVRIMTVHAAKGLEAPIVFLIDPGAAAWTPSKAPRLMVFDFPVHAGWSGKGFLWVPTKDNGTRFTQSLVDALKNRSEEEYRRLLYVGMTRAEDRLIVCGYRGSKVAAETWHELVSGGLADSSEQIDHPVSGVTARRYRLSEIADGEVDAVKEAAEQNFEPFPNAYFKPLPREAGLPRPLSPSGAAALIEADDEKPLALGSPVFAETEASPGFAIRRGTIIHALLQRLPDVPKGERREAALRYLARAASDWPERERDRVLESVFAVLDESAFAAVFSEGSMAELAIMGTLKLGSKEHAVSGKIDRMAISENRVLVVDYKTNRPPPATLDAVPDAYIAQLALYRALLRPLYPDREVAAALLFTEAPSLIEVPEDIMETALEKLSHPA
ncbi:MAG: double-strand break repair helicase AddA [Phyllobacterium sp.]